MQQPGNRFCKVSHIEIGVLAELGELLSSLSTFPRSDQHGGDFHGCKSLQISHIIADADAVLPIYFKVLRRPLEEPRQRFATPTPATLRRHAHARVVRAMVEAVDAGTEWVQTGVNLVLDRKQVAVIQQPAGNAGLIGNHNQLGAGSVKPSESLGNARQQLGLVSRGKVGHLTNQGAIAVKEDGRTSGHGRC